MIRNALIACLLAVFPLEAGANAPSSSIFPILRPGGQAVSPVLLPGLKASLVPAPRPRVARAPAVQTEPEEPEIEVEVAAAARAPLPPISEWAVTRSVRPDARPRNFAKIVRASTRSSTASYRVTSKFGKICGDRTIRGQTMSSIPGKIKGCGVAKPVKVYEVDGVKLSVPATMNCTTAKALKQWINGSVKPTVGKTGGGVASLKVVGHYSCRTRNHRAGGKISEHGKGNAIDIAAINLRNGRALTVLRGWRDPAQRGILRKVHAGACGPFGTVLGPDADRYHQDHFHFDVARHRGGAYCR